MPVTYEENKGKEQFVNLQAYDYDIFCKNHFIAQKSFPIEKLLKESGKYDVLVKFDNCYYENNYVKYFEKQIKNIDQELSAEEKKQIKENLNSIYDFIEFEADDDEKFWVKLDKGLNRKLVVRT